MNIYIATHDEYPDRLHRRQKVHLRPALNALIQTLKEQKHDVACSSEDGNDWARERGINLCNRSYIEKSDLIIAITDEGESGELRGEIGFATTIWKPIIFVRKEKSGVPASVNDIYMRTNGTTLFYQDTFYEVLSKLQDMITAFSTYIEYKFSTN